MTPADEGFADARADTAPPRLSSARVVYAAIRKTDADAIDLSTASPIWMLALERARRSDEAMLLAGLGFARVGKFEMTEVAE
jgi:hypothetical protein